MLIIEKTLKSKEASEKGVGTKPAFNVMINGFCVLYSKEKHLLHVVSTREYKKLEKSLFFEKKL